MPEIRYTWNDNGVEHSVSFALVEGTRGTPYGFGWGSGGPVVEVEVQDFFIGTTPVTQSFWTHVMGQLPPCCRMGAQLPVENVSSDELARPDGFLARLDGSEAGDHLLAQASLRDGTFRLPSETEWEYAARGGPHWRDGYRYSGGNDIEPLAWFDRRHGDHTQDVAQKGPNQLGLYDMCGNVWEWCQDAYDGDVTTIPIDGRPRRSGAPERVLRGGCFHNWAVHCTVFKRYQIERQCHDGCIGFRVVFAAK